MEVQSRYERMLIHQSGKWRFFGNTLLIRNTIGKLRIIKSSQQRAEIMLAARSRRERALILRAGGTTKVKVHEKEEARELRDSLFLFWENICIC